jgi:hypothetical protein
MDEKVKKYITRYGQLYIALFNPRLQFFYKVNTNVTKLYTGRPKEKFQQPLERLRIINLRHHHPADKQTV